jgi:hypothetical protein
MPSNFHRPGVNYVPESRPNDQQFKIYTSNLKRGIPDKVFDGQLGYLVDRLNDIDIRIDGISFGSLPGVADPINFGKLVTPDGAGSSTWSFVSAANVLDESLPGIKLIPQAITERELMDGGIISSKVQQRAIITSLLDDEAVTTEKISEGAVTKDKIAPGAVGSDEMADGSVRATELANNAVTTPKILDSNVTTSKIADDNIITSKLADGAVTTSKLADKTITSIKINSEVAPIGNVLTADGAGSASFLPNMGRILQIQSYSENRALLTTGNSSGQLSSFSTPFAVNITPISSSSKIFLYYSIYMISQIDQVGSYTIGRIFKNGTSKSGNNYDLYIHESDNVSLGQLSGLIPYGQNLAGTPITFEIKAGDLFSNYFVKLNNATSSTVLTTSYLHAIEIDI